MNQVVPHVAADQRRGVALITGASGGVGRALAHVLADAGYDLALLARGRDRLEAARAEAEARGVRAIALVADVSEYDALRTAAKQAEERLGPIDVWINNAMVTILSPLEKITPEEYAQITNVTYLGAVYGTMVALEHMKPRDHGHIIQVGSALAYRAIPLQSAYCGAKHAERGFTDSLRSELIHDRSRVLLSMAHLPAMNTPQFSWSRTRLPNAPQPVPPIYDPHVAARAIASIIGTQCREIWVAAPTWKTIVGSKVVPRFLDRFLARAAYDGQQTDQPLAEDRPDNLFSPAPGDFGTCGTFGDRSRKRSWLTRVLSRWERLASTFRARHDYRDEIPPGWEHNPASWSQRVPIVVLALLGFVVASYLGLYQIDAIDDVWEPFFGDGSKNVLDSKLSRVVPIPDAWLGAFGYLADAISGMIGGRKRWKTMPWIVVLFGLLVGPLGGISIALVMSQPLVVGSWCTLCLMSAVISVLMIGPAMDEMLASLQYLRRVQLDGRVSLWQAFWGVAQEQKKERRAPWFQSQALPQS